MSNFRQTGAPTLYTAVSCTYPASILYYFLPSVSGIWYRVSCISCILYPLTCMLYHASYILRCVFGCFAWLVPFFGCTKSSRVVVDWFRVITSSCESLAMILLRFLPIVAATATSDARGRSSQSHYDVTTVDTVQPQQYYCSETQTWSIWVRRLAVVRVSGFAVREGSEREKESSRTSRSCRISIYNIWISCSYTYHTCDVSVLFFSVCFDPPPCSPQHHPPTRHKEGGHLKGYWLSFVSGVLVMQSSVSTGTPKLLCIYPHSKINNWLMSYCRAAVYHGGRQYKDRFDMNI